MTAGTFAACMVPPGACSISDANVHCDGTNAYRCVDGVAYGRDCSLSGSKCVDNGIGTGCVPTGPACASPAGTASCDATTLSICEATGESVSYDCSLAGEQCSPDAGARVSPGCTKPCVESCDGNSTITACVGGAPLPIDCSAIDSTDGFAFCGVTANGNGNGLPFAFCY